jgi:DNA-directed RNA polymerase
MKETTTLVQKLKAKKLSKFIDRNLESSHEIMLDNDKQSPIVFVSSNINELKLTKEGLREIVESYEAHQETEPVINENEGSVVQEELLLNEEEQEIIPDINPTKSKANSKTKPRFQGKLTDIELKVKHRSLALSLSAYIDCCVKNGMVNRGFLTLLKYRIKSKKAGMYGVKIHDVLIYNLLMRGYAEKENYLRLMDIIKILREDKIRLNEQTYSHLLECLGRISLNPDSLPVNRFENVDELSEKIVQLLDEAEKVYSISPNDIMNKSIFVKDQREMVLTAIRLVHPDFTPSYVPPKLTYNNELVNQLNENVKPISYDPIENIHEKCSGNEIMNCKVGYSREDLEKWSREQLLNELNGEVTIKSIINFPTPTNHVLNYREKLQNLQKKWKEVIISAFNREINVIKAEETRVRASQNLLPYLRALDVEQYANILMNEIRYLTEGSETFSPFLNALYIDLGEKVEMRYHIEQKMKLGVLQKTGEIYGNYCDVMVAGNSSDNSRQCWQRLVHLQRGNGPSVEYESQKWPMAAKIGVGRFLFQILIRDLKMEQNYLRSTKPSDTLIPAFFTLFRTQGKNIKEELKPHPMLMKLYRGSQQETLTFDVNLVPMVCPPKPYYEKNNGGYLIAHSNLIRLPRNCVQQLDLLGETEIQNLYPVLDSLNQQQSIAWQTNNDILDIVLKIFNEGGNDKLDIPEHPDRLTQPTASTTKSPATNENEMTNKEKFKFFRQKLEHRKKQAEMYSLWCDALYRLSLANHYRDRVFWLPQNLDFRGRLYSIPPHLSVLGNDLARSLLKFHQKKKLGIDGLAWLKLHCINLTGLKKRNSVRERMLFAEEVLDEIFDSADNPIDGNRWWMKSDEPWQTLAVCKEIANAIRSGDPENFESSIPVHQDGSCNGLQHYAALGRDTLGATSVNLAPSEIPQDVYSDVASLVEQARQKDEENGVQVAKELRNFIKRKVIKQTVMTTVYGVTKYGARLQIAKQLKDVEDFPQEWVWVASSYLANRTFESLREMFTSTREIQDWFVDCAKLISTVCNENVEWVTPLGLPIVQPYSRDKVKSFASKKMGDGDRINDLSKTPNTMKQRNAFPPNFIHSLDSCHMMLTSVYCEKIGLTFTSVHDCYWTHACTVPEMSRICREQFVALHSQPILEDLSKFLINKYSFAKK